jgi:hypothetical protein
VPEDQDIGASGGSSFYCINRTSRLGDNAVKIARWRGRIKPQSKRINRSFIPFIKTALPKARLPAYIKGAGLPAMAINVL